MVKADDAWGDAIAAQQATDQKTVDFAKSLAAKDPQWSRVVDAAKKQVTDDTNDLTRAKTTHDPRRGRLPEGALLGCRFLKFGPGAPRARRRGLFVCRYALANGPVRLRRLVPRPEAAGRRSGSRVAGVLRRRGRESRACARVGQSPREAPRGHERRAVLPIVPRPFDGRPPGAGNRGTARRSRWAQGDGRRNRW